MSKSFRRTADAEKWLLLEAGDVLAGRWHDPEAGRSSSRATARNGWHKGVQRSRGRPTTTPRRLWGSNHFAGGFSRKTSPVHHFWHTMEIAVTRYSDREVLYPLSADSVTREVYSREVISSGFWFGDPTFPEPASYSYTSPEHLDSPQLPSSHMKQSGSREATLIWRSTATTMHGPQTIRARRSWSSSKAPIGPERRWPDGTSIGSPLLTASQPSSRRNRV